MPLWKQNEMNSPVEKRGFIGFNPQKMLNISLRSQRKCYMTWDIIF